MSTTTLDSPALQHRSKHYPERYNGRVPKRVRIDQTVKSDQLAALFGQAMIAHPGEYDAWVNSHGAVAIILPNGNLGVKPDEFEVVEWHNESAE